MDFESVIGGMLKRKIELGDRLIGRLPAAFGTRAKELRDGCLAALARVTREFAEVGGEGGKRPPDGPRKVHID